MDPGGAMSDTATGRRGVARISRIGRGRCVAALASLFVAFGATLAPHAHAAGAWLGPAGISSGTPTSIGTPRIAVANDGTAWVIYARSDGANTRAEVAVRR